MKCKLDADEPVDVIWLSYMRNEVRDGVVSR